MTGADGEMELDDTGQRDDGALNRLELPERAATARAVSLDAVKPLGPQRRDGAGMFAHGEPHQRRKSCQQYRGGAVPCQLVFATLVFLFKQEQ